jgi:glucoamylase
VDASKEDVGGYHLVWARDLYEVATAFLAVGDRAAAERALNYLFATQQKPDGSYPQNSWLDGKPYWPSLQMDEVSYPGILAWQLGKTDKTTYEKHIKPAAEFVISNGPATPQERWEEKSGYSPSTIAAEIAGLICAADIARINGDESSRSRWMQVADDWAQKLPTWTVTHTGKYGPEYYIRIAQKGQPDAGGPIDTANGGGMWDEREIVDAGFLELVRLGITRPDDPLIVKSLPVVDKVIKVDTPNGPTFYRYNHDGYGEKANGKGYDGTGIGRLWIIFAGERGEYELARGRDAHSYLDAMQKMANAGGMLAEQVWDRPDLPQPWLKFGQGTGSATPLAWTNAQFVRLAIAVKEGKLPETPAVVRAHFQR